MTNFAITLPFTLDVNIPASRADRLFLIAFEAQWREHATRERTLALPYLEISRINSVIAEFVEISRINSVIADCCLNLRAYKNKYYLL